MGHHTQRTFNVIGEMSLHTQCTFNGISEYMGELMHASKIPRKNIN